MMFRWMSAVFVLAATLFLATSLAAEEESEKAETKREAKIGFRQLAGISPVAVERGTQTEVEVRSNFTLDESYEVFFDKPGITMTFAETEPIEAPRRGRGSAGTPFRFQVDVPDDQEPGVYEVRVATKQAVSSVAHLLVTEYPVVIEETDETGSRETAQEVPVPVAIAGTCDPGEDVDYYRFSGTAGQDLTVQIYAQRVTDAIHSMQCGGGIYLMNSLLTLYGPNGQVVAWNDNFFGGDSFFACQLPEDGEYVLEVRDARYIGNPKYIYCVEISDRPFVHATFPLAVQQGTSVEAEVLGHGLGDLEKTTLSTDEDETPGWKNVRIDTPRGESNLVSVLVSRHPTIVAPEGNLSRDEAAPLSLPVGVNGRFTEPDQTHYYSFEAEKNAYYLFEIESHRHGLPLDSVLEVYDANGKRLAEADDDAPTKDSKLYFRAPDDGTYVVSVRDLHDRGGDRFLYYLRAEPSGPDFELQGEYYYAQIAPGTHMMWFVQINRLNGFDGPVEIEIEDLPEGVSFVPVTIPAGMTRAALVLECAPDAEINASLVRVLGKAEIAGPDGESQEVVRYGQVTCELQTQGGSQRRWPIKTQLVGVTKPLDLLAVEADVEEVTLKPGEKAEINVRIERHEEFSEPVTLAMDFKYFRNVLGAQLPPGVKMSNGDQVRLAGETLEGKIVLEAEDDALPVERLPIAVLARVPITFSITTNFASTPIHLTVASADADEE